MHQVLFLLGLRPRPRWGSSQCSPKIPSWVLGALPLREGTEGEARERKGREGKAAEAPNSHFWLRHWEMAGPRLRHWEMAGPRLRRWEMAGPRLRHWEMAGPIWKLRRRAITCDWFELNTGIPVTPARGIVHTNVGFPAAFSFQASSPYKTDRQTDRWTESQSET